MSIFDRLGSIFNIRRSREDKHVQQNRAGTWGRALSGVHIDEDNCLEIPAMFAANRYLTQTTAVLPWRVMRKTRGGSEIQNTHPVDWLLHVRPSLEWSSFQFRETLVSWAFRHGNGWAEIERDVIGRPLALWPIHPTRLQLCRDEDTGELYGEVQNGVGQPKVEIPYKDLFHIRGYGDSVLGVSAVRYMAQSLGWARSAQLFGAAFFGNGLHTSDVIQSKAGMKPDAVKRLKAEIRAATRGPNRWHEPLVLDNGAEIKQRNITPEQAQFIATNEFLVDEVSRISGVPPHKLSQLARATFSNIEHQSIEVVQDAIVPWVKRLEDEADYKLFGQNRVGYFTKLNVRGLLRGDFKSQMEGFEVMRRNGAINADEWRDLVDMNRMPDGAGGELYVMQSQNWPLDKLGSDAAAKAAAANPAEPEPQDDDPPAANDDEAAAMATVEIMAAECAHVG